MELTKQNVEETKGVAILFMFLLHLFCTKSYSGLFQPIIYVGKYPLIYYLALFGDCCVALYCFCSGYGLMHNYQKDKAGYSKKNRNRIFNLYIKYWIIIVLFVLIGGTILNKPGYPGSINKFLLTVTGIAPAYNGAWWFFTTYILLVLFSKRIYEVILKRNSVLIVAFSLIFYVLGYIQRIKVPIVLDNIYLDYFLRQLALFGTSQFPFVIGGVFQKEKIYSKINIRLSRERYKDFYLYSIIIGMIIVHSFIETLFIAVFTGIVFIVCFNLISKKEYVSSFFRYMGKHSTNLWLIHMFFYMIYFKKLVYSPKYPILIYIWLIILCLPFSYLIDKIEENTKNIALNYKNTK
ncbi:acyltransferase family protein [Cetobacterium sp.]|uniref:acyltransferase family protein n=1 Tax=Cetobacterium sp. TaxID=2071632 RepID=UPI003F40DF61